MKKLLSKKILSIICASFLLFSLGVSEISAARAGMFAGNVDMKESLSVKDATLIQKYLAGMEEFTYLQELLADTDGDGKVTVKDVTLIQKDIAGIARIESAGVFPYAGGNYFYPDYNSGKAMAGVPVTFYAEGFTYDQRGNPVTYEFYIDGEVMQERSEQSTFTHTFEKAGTYHISLKIYNKFDIAERIYGYYDYTVVEPFESESPVIKAFYCTEQLTDNELFEVHDEKKLTFVAETIKGSGEYEYAFLLDGKSVRDFSSNNTCTCLFEEPEYDHIDDPVTNNYTLQVIVKDKNTDLSACETYDITISIPIPA